MSSLTLTRRITFSAAHRYGRPEWSDAVNAAAFGGTSLRDVHDHLYVCDVTVGGTVDESTGMLVDLRVLDSVLQTEVVDRFNGRTLNRDISQFADGKQIPTGENLARLIAALVQGALEEQGDLRIAVTTVTVAEDPTLSVTWRASHG